MQKTQPEDLPHTQFVTSAFLYIKWWSFSHNRVSVLRGDKRSTFLLEHDNVKTAVWFFNIRRALRVGNSFSHNLWLLGWQNTRKQLHQTLSPFLCPVIKSLKSHSVYLQLTKPMSPAQSSRSPQRAAISRSQCVCEPTHHTSLWGPTEDPKNEAVRPIFIEENESKCCLISSCIRLASGRISRQLPGLVPQTLNLASAVKSSEQEWCHTKRVCLFTSPLSDRKPRCSYATKNRKSSNPHISFLRRENQSSWRYRPHADGWIFTVWAHIKREGLGLLLFIKTKLNSSLWWGSV